jgi:Flp pilus assembly protein TadG
MLNRTSGRPNDKAGGHRRSARNSEGGYVLPMTALLLIPLMIFAAFAVDVGAWYVRADQAQRAADAAALAGTVWMPDQVKAREVALDMAARNGFRDPDWTAVNGGTSNAAIATTATGDGALRVDVTTQSESQFGRVVLDSINLERRAVATVSEPVRMGNPSNGLGTGNLAVSELGFPGDWAWLAVSGWCYDHRNGDPISVGYAGTYYAGGNPYAPCTTANGGPNPTHDPDGYTFVVDVPPGAGDVALEIFEPGLCTDSNPYDSYYSAEDRYTSGPRINARVYQNDNTELYHEDNLAAPPVADILYDRYACVGGSSGGGRWYNMYTIPAGTLSEGRWYIQTSVRMNRTDERGPNYFAIRARPTSDSQLCTSVLDATCPELYALDYLPLWRPNFGGAGTAAEFFLADISDEHAGKNVHITLFDPGEGMNNIQFLDPSNNPVPFTYQLVNCSVGLMCSNDVWWPEDTTDHADADCGGNPCLDVTSSRYQDQWVRVRVTLDPTYNCGSNCWWKVRYTPSAGVSVSDRTTWSVHVVGGPVHLVE